MHHVPSACCRLPLARSCPLLFQKPTGSFTSAVAVEAFQSHLKEDYQISQTIGPQTSRMTLGRDCGCQARQPPMVLTLSVGVLDLPLPTQKILAAPEQFAEGRTKNEIKTRCALVKSRYDNC